MGDDLRFFVLFAPFATDLSCTDGTNIEADDCFYLEQSVAGFDASGDIVSEEIWDFGVDRPRVFYPDEFVRDGSVGGLDWRLKAGSDRCFEFTLGPRMEGGSACLADSGPGWFGEVGQRVEPQRPDVAPVYGPIPSHVDDVTVVLDDGSEINARILRPENHPIAYYLAWIPDGYATGSVRFVADGSELGSRQLCAEEHRTQADGFICYGSPEAR